MRRIIILQDKSKNSLVQDLYLFSVTHTTKVSCDGGDIAATSKNYFLIITEALATYKL